MYLVSDSSGMEKHFTKDERYIPIREMENILVRNLIPSVIKGISYRVRDKYSIEFGEPEISKDRYNGNKVFNVYVSVVVSYNDLSKPPSTNNRLWLASFPRLDKNGLFVIDRKRYYVVMRQRLIPNVPICTIKGPEKDLVCIIRSENIETLESVVVAISRSKRPPKRITVSTRVKNPKPQDLVSYLRALSRTSDWQRTLLNTLSYLRASETVVSIIRSSMIDSLDVVESSNMLPSTANIDHSQYYVDVSQPLDETYNAYETREVSTEYIILCQALVKFLRVECGEIEPDDCDDYSNKVVDNYAVWMGKLFRKIVLKMESTVANVSNPYKAKIYEQLRDAITDNKWQIVDKHKEELKISRMLDVGGDASIEGSLHEIITLSSTHAGEDVEGQNFSLRYSHPSQLGYICTIRTADDNKAGLKSWIASDCVVTSISKWGQTLEYNNLRESIVNLESLKDSTSSERDKIIWLHNSKVVYIASLQHILEIVLQAKKVIPELSLSINDLILETRSYYGRLAFKTVVEGVTYLVDTRESYRYKDVGSKPSMFSTLCNAIPFLNRCPVPRLMVTSKQMQKCIPYEMTKNNMLDSACIETPQYPLVVTKNHGNFIYGQNVVVLYGTFKGLTVQDGIVINKTSIENGILAIYKRTSEEWIRKEDEVVSSYTIHVKRNSKVVEGTVLVEIQGLTSRKDKFYYKLKHSKYYSCFVENIEVKYDNSEMSRSNRQGANLKILSPAYVTSIVVTFVRRKIPGSGDKFSSRSGQKSVCTIVGEEDFPGIIDYSNRFCKADLVMSTIAMPSRGTVSQEVCSFLGALVAELKGEIAVDSSKDNASLVIDKDSTLSVNLDYNPDKGLTGGTGHGVVKYLDQGSSTIGLPSYKVYVYDPITLKLFDSMYPIGIEYYFILPQIADEKMRTKGYTSRDEVTGSIKDSKSETCTRYNWQEMGALLHTQSHELLSSIYDEGEKGNFPYCDSCGTKVDAYQHSTCEHCMSKVDKKITMSRSFSVVSQVLEVLGIETKVYGQAKKQ